MNELTQTDKRIGFLMRLIEVHNLSVSALSSVLVILIIIQWFFVELEFVPYFFTLILVVDTVFVASMLILFGKSQYERSKISSMAVPLGITCVILLFVIPIINFIREIEDPLPLPFFLGPTLPALTVLFLIILLGQSYWSSNAANPRTSGERVSNLNEWLICGSSFSAFILTITWVKIILAIGAFNLRVDLLWFMVPAAFLFPLAWFLDIKIHWQEQAFSVGLAGATIVMSVIAIIATSYGLINLRDPLKFTWEFTVLFAFYFGLLGSGEVIFNRLGPRFTLLLVIIQLLPLYLWLYIAVYRTDELVVRILEYLNKNIEKILSGAGWIFGALAGSAIFAFLIRLSIRGKIAGRRNINKASLSDIQKIPGISLQLSQAIVQGQPYDSIEELSQRVSGVGPIRTKYIKERFYIPSE